MWFGAVITEIGSYLNEILGSDLEEIHHSLRVTTDVNQLLRATEKYFAITANYAKGKGTMFMDWMNRYHCYSYLYPVARAYGGSRQDIGVEGAGPILMNIPYYLGFLVWRISSGGDGLLEKNLYHLFRSV